MSLTLTLTGRQHDLLRRHLFPGDGREAVAFLLCGRTAHENRTRLLVRKIAAVPYEHCSARSPDHVTWPTSWLLPLLAEATKAGLSVIKVHCHGDFADFSSVDDRSDRALFPSLYAWVEGVPLHGSAIMLANGAMFGRIVDDAGQFMPVNCVNVAGADLPFWHRTAAKAAVPEHGTRIAQTFGQRTYEVLHRLRIAVIGASGTGSGVIEQLARNAVGELVLVDPDVVEPKNLNRIWNATANDAEARTPKVETAARAVAAMGLGTKVLCLQRSLFDPEVVRAVAACDVVFGCMDSIDGRFLLNKLASFYCLPYFDLGVKIEADGHGGVDQVCGSVHYLQPDGSSLLSRQVFNPEQVRAAGMRRTDPAGFKKQVEEGYIRGGAEERPAVIQLNTLIASLAVSELLARLHPYRLDPNDVYAVQRVSLSHGLFDHEADGTPCPLMSRHVGRGDVEPLLDMAELSINAP